MSDRGVFSIPAGASFVDDLARGLIRRHGADPAAFADMRILVPTRRGVRSLIDAFLRAAAGKAMVLPRITAIGDVDEDALAIDQVGDGNAALDLPPAIADLHRRILLARLVAAQQPRRGGGMPPEHAIQLAIALGRFLDEVQIEAVELDDLASLAPEELAHHWQRIVGFLGILTRHWPAILADHGALDPADRRNRLLDAQAARWRADPPPAPVIAAGSTGTVPATARLLQVVSELPMGVVVLPGLDRSIATADWARLPAHHPQYGLRRLLDVLEVDRESVVDWPESTVSEGSRRRAQLLAESLRPAASEPIWMPGPDTVDDAAPALDGLFRIDCATAEEEAGVIALLMRQSLETSDRSAALVTPDRALARRVAAELRRWDIEIDDSAGTPLDATPPGVFLRLVAEAAATRLAPIELLAVLKHPLAAAGYASPPFRSLVRAIEIAALRGPRRSPGVAPLKRALRGRSNAAARKALTRVASILGPLTKALSRRSVDLPGALRVHIATAEALAASDTESGTVRLWRGEAGETAAEFVDEAIAAAAAFPRFAGAHYPSLFVALMTGRTVRPRYGRHPRLHIWGPLEARLQRVDRMILGGLNEGTWPAEPAADPWMNRPMRLALGLPPPERQIGLAAHDFVQAVSAPEVFLTRAQRVDGTPTVESRWLLRLDTTIRVAGAAPDLIRDDRFLSWWRQLDQPDAYAPRSRPEPRPPVEARPTRLSVTRIETWMRDPYAVYARHVLGLKALEPVDADPGVADRGLVVHKALENFIAAHPAELPPDALDRLIACGEAAFADYRDRPAVRAFWWPRFERIARWFVATEATRRREVAESRSEVQGCFRLEDRKRAFTVTAKADRIDRMRDGRLVIVDYKTGGLPPKWQMENGLAPQLPLEALLSAEGGFRDVPSVMPAGLQYWRLTGGEPAGAIKDFPVPPEIAAERARDRLVDLIRAFADPATPYLPVPRSDAAPAYSDYDHLARTAEWSAERDSE